MKILVDMNLSPDWVPVLENQGWETIHWSEIGDIRALDDEIMAWALTNGFVVFTHDLDFSAILAVTKAAGPSVIQVRGQDVLPSHLGQIVVVALQQFESLLVSGALISIDEASSRARILPIAN